MLEQHRQGNIGYTELGGHWWNTPFIGGVVCTTKCSAHFIKCRVGACRRNGVSFQEIKTRVSGDSAVGSSTVPRRQNRESRAFRQGLNLGGVTVGVALSRDAQVGPLSSNAARSVVLSVWLTQDHDREARLYRSRPVKVLLARYLIRRLAGTDRARFVGKDHRSGRASRTTDGHNFAIQSGPRRSAAFQWADLPVTGHASREPRPESGRFRAGRGKLLPHRGRRNTVLTVGVDH